jgi:hypothetical protein
MATPRILMVYPYPNIESNPTMALLLETLDSFGAKVHVLFAKSDTVLMPARFGPNVEVERWDGAAFHFRPYRPSRKAAVRGLLTKALPPLLVRRHGDENFLIWFALRRMRNYDLAIGVDPGGISVVDRLNTWARIPIAYVSFELMFRDELEGLAENSLLEVEQQGASAARVILLQDEERKAAFCREHAIDSNRIVTAPVAPPPRQVQRTDALRARLGIPPSKRIVLFCGNIQAWSSRDELEDMVSCWPERYCLVIHSWDKVGPRLRQYLAGLRQTGKIFVSSELVARQEMPDFVASADFGLAPYKPTPEGWLTGKNLYHLGLASGKVSYYALCGLPILARALPVYDREFAVYRCGKTYRLSSETGRLLEEMDSAYAVYSKESRRFFDERLNPVPGITEFCRRLLAVDAGRRQ